MSQWDEKTRKFTFRCEKCKDVLASQFDDEQDIADVLDDVLWLECPCSGKMRLLRD